MGTENTRSGKNVETKREELKTIILNQPEICDSLLSFLQAAKDRQSDSAEIHAANAKQ